MWSVLSGIAFIAQVLANGGPGVWVMGLTAAACFFISVLASFKTEEQFKTLDWISFGVALLALLLWRYTKNPNLAVVLVSLSFAVGFVPTFRKGFFSPHEETAVTFAFNVLKFGLSIIALSTFSLSTWLYPATLVVCNALFVILLLVRRNQIDG